MNASRAIAVVAVLVVACRAGESGSRRDMRALCAAPTAAPWRQSPAERDAALTRWVTEHIRDRDVARRWSDAVARPPLQRAEVLDIGVRLARLPSCALADFFQDPWVVAIGDVDVPTLDDERAIGGSSNALVVRVSPELISAGYFGMASLNAGAFVDEEARTTGLGALATYLRSAGATDPTPSGAPWPRIVVGGDIRSPLIYDVLRTVRDVGRVPGAPIRLPQSALVVRTNAGFGMIPVAMSDEPPDRRSGVRMVLEFRDGGVVALWSLSNVEGSIASPLVLIRRADPRALDQLRAALAAVVARHWPDPRDRQPFERVILVVPTPTTTAGELVTLMAAARIDRDGHELFPDARLSLPLVLSPPDQDTALSGRPGGPAADQLMNTLSAADAARFADLLADPGDDDLVGDLTRRTPNADLSQQIEDVVGVGAGSGTAAGGGDGAVMRLGAQAPPTTTTERIRFGTTTVGGTTSLTSDVVVHKVAIAYASGIKRCYREALVALPTLGGTITIALAVNEVGRATSPTVTAPTDGLRACVANLTRIWRFPVPTIGSNPATETATLTIELSPR